MNDTSAQLDTMDRYWRAANDLSVGQIYLMDNPLLREPLRAEHVKPRLLGRWGTTPASHPASFSRRRSVCPAYPKAGLSDG